MALQWVWLLLVEAAPSAVGDATAEDERFVEFALQLINLLLLFLPGARLVRSISAVGAAAADAPCSERHSDAVRPVWPLSSYFITFAI